MFLHLHPDSFISHNTDFRELSVHFCAMASSPLGRMRLKGSPPTPVNPRPMLGSRAVSPVLAEEVWTLAVDPPGPGRISGSDSLAWGADPGLVAEGEVVLAVWGLVGVVGLVRPRLARASRVPSGSTITLITGTGTGREWMCRRLCAKSVYIYRVGVKSDPDPHSTTVSV